MQIQPHPSVTMERIEDAFVDAWSTLGICVACGADQNGVKLDARRRRCNTCTRHAVYGAQELLMLMSEAA